VLLEELLNQVNELIEALLIDDMAGILKKKFLSSRSSAVLLFIFNNEDLYWPPVECVMGR
jgi:hypothetical protein